MIDAHCTAPGDSTPVLLEFPGRPARPEPPLPTLPGATVRRFDSGALFALLPDGTRLLWDPPGEPQPLAQLSAAELRDNTIFALRILVSHGIWVKSNSARLAQLEAEAAAPPRRAA